MKSEWAGSPGPAHSSVNPAAISAAFQQVSTDLSKIGGPENPTAALRSNKELETAFKAAPTCQKIDLLDSSDSTPTS